MNNNKKRTAKKSVFKNGKKNKNRKKINTSSEKVDLPEANLKSSNYEDKNSIYNMYNNVKKESNRSNERVVVIQKDYSNLSRNFAFIMFLFITIYILGYFFVFLSKPVIATEVVEYGYINDVEIFNGIIVRDEYVEKTSIDGFVDYVHSENDMVKKNALICNIKQNDEVEILIENIDEINEEILELQKKRGENSIFSQDIKEINNSITETVNSYTYKFNDNDFSLIYDLRNYLDNEIQKRTNIWSFENVDAISSLEQSKLNNETQLSEISEKIYSKESGILTFKVDGLEEILTPDSLLDISEEQTIMNAKPENATKNVSIDAGEDVFKIVKSNTWYVASYLPKEFSENLAVGDYVYLKIYDDSYESTTQFTIVDIDHLYENSYVVFKSEKNILNYLHLRNIQFSIEKNALKGLKIPNSAIIEKTLIKIPVDYLVYDENKAVTVSKNTIEGPSIVNIKFSYIDSDDNNEDTVEYAYVMQDFESLALGEVILSPPDMQLEPYELKSISANKGVFVVNSSIAEFVVIDVLEFTDTHSIVDIVERSSSLKIYDNIISDVKAITEGDIIF